ncbi:hypothetical protein ACOMHN_055074 [Nucella lapillus]
MSTGRPRRGSSADVAISRPAEPHAEAPPPASEPEELMLGVVVSMLQRMEGSLNGKLDGVRGDLKALTEQFGWLKEDVVRLNRRG